MLIVVIEKLGQWSGLRTTSIPYAISTSETMIGSCRMKAALELMRPAPVRMMAVAQNEVLVVPQTVVRREMM